jgi:NTP pyrophosphatase (non-canonical NTP hydrolase)
MSNTDNLTEALIQLRNERDWEQFHNPKDVAITLSLEAGELLENFLWKQPQDADVSKIKEELADVLAYAQRHGLLQCEAMIVGGDWNLHAFDLVS